MSSATEPSRDKRRKWKGYLRRLFPRGIRFTRQGKLYTAVTLGVGFAAVNTGNNLLYLVLGLMLGLIIVSGILSELSLRGLVVKRSLGQYAEARVPFPVELAVRNSKRFAASFGVELRDEIDGTPFRRRCFFLRVGAGERRSIAYRCEINRRGKARFNGTIISTRFPFGLFEKTRFIPLVDDVIVLPAPIWVNPPRVGFTKGEGRQSLSVKGAGQEFREIKEMVFGDDPRRIDWRSTARMGRPMVRESDVDASGFIEIVLDPALLRDTQDERRHTEQNISAAATVIRHMTARGTIVRLVTTPPAVLVASQPSDTLPLLTHLALIDVRKAAGSPAPRGESPESILIGPRADTSGTATRLRVPSAVVTQPGVRP